jgi:hypothetical protein
MLSAEEETKLNRIIHMVAYSTGGHISQPQYIRELILNHIKEYLGEDQKSFVDEDVKRLIRHIELTKQQIPKK